MSLASSYAKALYMAAKEGGASNDALDDLETQMDAFAQALTQPEIHRGILGPVVSGKEKMAIFAVLAQKAGYSKIFANFLSLLINRGRLPLFPKIQDAFGSVRLEAEGGVEGRLVSAEAVSDADVQGLAQAFGRKLGKKVAFRVTTDASLLAGMKVTVNGTTYDGSLRSQLHQLRERLMAGTPAN